MPEIVKVDPDRLDEHCVVVTLKHRPSFFARLFGRRHRVVTYKGHADNWYALPSYQPARKDTKRFLNKIVNDNEFRHHQVLVERKRQSKTFPLVKRTDTYRQSQQL